MSNAILQGEVGRFAWQGGKNFGKTVNRMESGIYKQWKGFERAPHGCLLDQVIDLSGVMGVAYERCLSFYKDFHIHERLMLVLPRGASSMAVRTRSPGESFRVTGSSCLIVPQDIEHDDEGTSAIYDTLALYPSAEFVTQIGASLNLTPKDIKSVYAQCRLVERTPSFERFIEDYSYERIVRRDHSGDHVRALEVLIVREILKILCPRQSDLPEEKRSAEFQQAAGTNETAIKKALRYIEANLFAELSSRKMARRVGASESKLLRAFHGALNTTPATYVRERRMEEAKKLLEGTSRSVGEIALLVGYNNFGAFSEAFKRTYGKAPRQWRRDTADVKPSASGHTETADELR